MIALETFFRPVFGAHGISHTRLKLFTEDHLGRLAAENEAGEVSGMLAATQSAYQAYFGAIEDRVLAAALRTSLTRAKDGALRAFIERVRQREGRVRDHFGKGSPEYLDFSRAG